MTLTTDVGGNKERLFVSLIRSLEVSIKAIKLKEIGGYHFCKTEESRRRMTEMNGKCRYEESRKGKLHRCFLPSEKHFSTKAFLGTS